MDIVSIILLLVGIAFIIGGISLLRATINATSRKPKKITLLPPIPERFHTPFNEHCALKFFIRYDADVAKNTRMRDDFTRSEIRTNAAEVLVPKGAKLTSIAVLYSDSCEVQGRHYCRTFWSNEVRLPYSVKRATSIMLNFTLPGDEFGTSAHFKLV